MGWGAIFPQSHIFSDETKIMLFFTLLFYFFILFLCIYQINLFLSIISQYIIEILLKVALNPIAPNP